MGTDERIDPRLTCLDEARTGVERDRRQPGVAPEQPTAMVGDMGDRGPEHGTSDPEVAEVFPGRHSPEPPRGPWRWTVLAECRWGSLQRHPHGPDDGPVVADSGERSGRRVVVIGQGQLVECLVGAEHGLPQSPGRGRRDRLDTELHTLRVPVIGRSTRGIRAGPNRVVAEATTVERMTDRMDALRATSDRLDRVVRGLDPAQIERSAYPTDWSIADVLSHLGSGAVLFQRRVDDGLAGRETPDDVAQPVWDAWNAKEAQAKVTDGLNANRALVERIDSLTDEERGRFRFSMGPMVLDLDGTVGLRLNEVALHLWDIEVGLDPLATVAPEAVECVVDNLEMISRFAGKPTGAVQSVAVRTSRPRRDFQITLDVESLSLAPSDPVEAPDLELPAEALIRLVYGRLDPEHTPDHRGSADLDGLRRAFPGF